MTKKELIEIVAKKISGSSVGVDLIITEIFETIKEAIINGEEKIVINEFGNFVLKERASRMGRNPKTGEKIMIPPSRGVGFKPAKSFKEALKSTIKSQA